MLHGQWAGTSKGNTDSDGICSDADPDPTTEDGRSDPNPTYKKKLSANFFIFHKKYCLPHAVNKLHVLVHYALSDKRIFHKNF